MGGREWLQCPSVDLAFFSSLKATYTVLDFVFFLFNQPPPESPYLSAHSSFQWELRFTSPGCPLLPAQSPHTTACLTAGALQLAAGATVLLETYARRLRHTIAASFFSAQEARRVRHLHTRLQRRYERQGGQRPPLGPPSCSRTPVYQHEPSLDRQADHTLATGRNQEHAAEG